MAEPERGGTDERLLPEARRSPTVAELEKRIDYALAVARSAESAAVQIGATAVDAAEQASRAAELAERASEHARAGGAPPWAVAPSGGSGGAPVVDERLQRFVERADRVIGRLRTIGPLPERTG